MEDSILPTDEHFEIDKQISKKKVKNCFEILPAETPFFPTEEELTRETKKKSQTLLKFWQLKVTFSLPIDKTWRQLETLIPYDKT